MKPLVRCFSLVLLTLALVACVSPPAPKYQPAISNTELLLKGQGKLAVGDFVAAKGVSNQSLAVRASELKGGGSDGTFSGYLQDAMRTELQTSARYDVTSDLRISGVVTRNELSAGVGTGTATLGAEFVLTRNRQVCFKKTLVAEHQWGSSFIGAVAIPAAFNNYPTAVQKLLGELFADPDFIAAAQSPVAPPGTAGRP